MILDVYKSKLAVKPCTRLRSWADMVNWLEYNKEVEVNCAKLKETGDKSYKEKLPAIMPMGSVGDLTRKKENCDPTGLVMIDIDLPKALKKMPYRTPWAEGLSDEYVAWWNNENPKKLVWEMLCNICDTIHKDGDEAALKALLKHDHVVYIGITPSTQGLRLLVHCHADGMEETIKRVSSDLFLSRFGEVDEACTDLSRLSFLVPEDYVIWREGLFDDVPAISIEQMKKYKATGIIEKHSNTQVDLGEVEKSDLENMNFQYNGHNVADLVAEYIEVTGGVPEEGERHNFYNKLIVQFRNLCNNNPRIVHAVLPMFGNSVEETWAQCVGLCSSNKTTRLEKNIYFFLKDRGYLLERATPAMPEEKQEEEVALPPMPKLPPIFRQYVNAAPKDFKIPTVFALLPILGTLTSHVRSIYIDDSEHSTEFITLLFAPPSSGKSFIKRLSALLQNLRDRDALGNAREELYVNAENKRSQNEKGEDAPHVSVRIVKPLISIPELLTKMRDNHGHHMYIEAEELDTFNKGNRTAGGDKSDLWRVTWDNGFYGQYYKSKNTFKGEVQMFLNLLFTSTQDQIDRFFKNVEDGLVTRFSVCPILNQEYAKFEPWKKIPKKDMLQVQNILDRLEMKVYKMPLKFDKEDLIDIKSEDFDNVVPWQYEFQPLEYVDLEYIYPVLLDWLEKERIKAAETLNPARDVFRRRAAVKGFRLALLCHALYNTIGKKERETIIEFVKWFCTVDLHYSLYQFGQRYNELQNNVTKQSVPHNKIFEKMSDTFTKTDVRIALQKAFMKTPVKVVISLWKNNKLIEKRGDEYIKIKK